MSLEKTDGETREAVLTAANDAVEGQVLKFRMPVVEIAPATDGSDADTTVVIQPINDDAQQPGAALKRAPAPADRERAAKTLSLLKLLALDGSCSRTELLTQARREKIVSPNPASGSEQLRKALVILSDCGSVTYSEQEVQLANAS
jgi:hypothetical protein